MVQDMLSKRGERQDERAPSKNGKFLRRDQSNLDNELTGEEDDPFNMNVMFYDGETPINDFKSRQEFVEREVELERSKFITIS